MTVPVAECVCVPVRSEVGREGLSGNEAEEVSPIGRVRNVRVKNIPPLEAEGRVATWCGCF